MKVKHGMHRVYRMYKKMAERKYECKVESKVTPRDRIKGMSYRRRAKRGHQLHDVVTHLLNDTIEASLPEARDLAHMAQNVDELCRQLQQLKNAL